MLGVFPLNLEGPCKGWPLRKGLDSSPTYYTRALRGFLKKKRHPLRESLKERPALL